MPTTDELVQWAQNHANALEKDMTWTQAGSSQYWMPSSRDVESKIRARVIAALDFLDRFTGHDSQWTVRGREVADNNRSSMASGARALGDVLREWASAVAAGIVVVPQVEAQGARAVASTDLMDQVRVLAEDRSVRGHAPLGARRAPRALEAVEKVVTAPDSILDSTSDSKPISPGARGA